MNRRGFLSGLVAITAAPAIVRAESLMRIWVPPAPKIWYSTSAERIAMLQGEILSSAIPIELLEAFGRRMVMVREMIRLDAIRGCDSAIYTGNPKTVTFRRWSPFAGPGGSDS